MTLFLYEDIGQFQFYSYFIPKGLGTPSSDSPGSCDFIACLVHEEFLNQSHENMQALKLLKKVTDRLMCVQRMGGWNNIGPQFPYCRRTGKLWESLLWRT